MFPAIFELDENNEATGTVHFFCTDVCRSRFIENGNVRGRYACDVSTIPNDGLVCEFCDGPLVDTSQEDPTYDEPDIDDTVYECPNCERPQQFRGLCATCMEEMRSTPDDPFWQRLAERKKL